MLSYSLSISAVLSRDFLLAVSELSFLFSVKTSGYGTETDETLCNYMFSDR